MSLSAPEIPDWVKTENTLIALTAAIGYDEAVEALDKLTTNKASERDDNDTRNNSGEWMMEIALKKIVNLIQELEVTDSGIWEDVFGVGDYLDEIKDIAQNALIANALTTPKE